MRVGRRAWRRGLVEGHDKLRRRDLLAISEDAPGPQYGRTSLAQVAAADVWVFKRMARDTRSGIGPDADGFPLLLRAIDLALAGAVRGEGARVHAEHQGAQLQEGLRPSSSVPADRGATLAQISRTARSEAGIMEWCHQVALPFSAKACVRSLIV
jgi:hypothetical protein